VRPGKLSVIGNGVVLDPHALLGEIAQLKKQGIVVTPDNLRIAENTPLILPLHQELDVAREKASGKGAIGTRRSRPAIFLWRAAGGIRSQRNHRKPDRD